MKTLLVIILLVPLSRAPLSGGVPPSCADADSIAVASRVEQRMMADPSHEHIAIIQPNDGTITTQATGTVWSTRFSASLRETINSCFIQMEVKATSPAVEDVQSWTAMDVLEARLIGYDTDAGVWSRCTFTKSSPDNEWPVITWRDKSTMYAQVQAYYRAAKGSEEARNNTAYKHMWRDWAATHGVIYTCEVIQ